MYFLDWSILLYLHVLFHAFVILSVVVLLSKNSSTTHVLSQTLLVTFKDSEILQVVIIVNWYVFSLPTLPEKVTGKERKVFISGITKIPFPCFDVF